MVASHSPAESAGRSAVAIPGQVRGLREQTGAGPAAVEHRELAPGVEAGLGDVPADERRTADDQDAHAGTDASRGGADNAARAAERSDQLDKHVAHGDAHRDLAAGGQPGTWAGGPARAAGPPRLVSPMLVGPVLVGPVLVSPVLVSRALVRAALVDGALASAATAGAAAVSRSVVQMT